MILLFNEQTKVWCKNFKWYFSVFKKFRFNVLLHDLNKLVKLAAVIDIFNIIC